MSSGIGQLNWSTLFAAQQPSQPLQPTSTPPAPAQGKAEAPPAAAAAAAEEGQQRPRQATIGRKRGRRGGGAARGGGGGGGKRRRTTSRRGSETTTSVFQFDPSLLPGDSPEEIEAWIAARKARYPRLGNAAAGSNGSQTPEREGLQDGTTRNEKKMDMIAEDTSAQQQPQQSRRISGSLSGGRRKVDRRTRDGAGLGKEASDDAENDQGDDLPPEEGPSQAEANADWIRQNAVGPQGAARAASNRRMIPCRWYTSAKGHCRKGDRCPYLHDPEKRQLKYEAQFWYSRDEGWSLRDFSRGSGGGGGGGGRGRRVGSGRGKNTLYLPPPAQSLLKQLVRTEIRSEHQQILQALEYFVEMNFFKDAKE